MPVIEWLKDGSVAVIRMCNTANKQNLVFVEEMNRCLDEIEADKEIYAVVLTSDDEKNFCQGIDIEWLTGKMGENDVDSIKAFLHGINGIFKRFLFMPLPMIAAINGHAFGNGAMLACTCDFRFMKKDKGFFCFPEVDISIPFLPGMIQFVRKAIPEYKFNEMILSGKRVGAEELYQSHVIVKASSDKEELIKDAMAFARTFTKKRGIFGELKKRMHKNIVQVMETEDVQQIESMGLFIDG
ncbi:MAG: enoyl-CoA hydratase [Desulfobacula sp. RIFOXYA12_FULL_46_16]|nr:MAG: enoyl-CoA hydratase [Desulfobacula sp. RIFOXYA12_FULL_46_16]OGR37353.1 MAG: enoyl-CoA hydratase [Desulfobacula sp. RIFOXYB2_FULL_45_6]